MLEKFCQKIQIKIAELLRLFLYTLIDPETKDIMKCIMKNNVKFKMALREMSGGLNEETKQVNRVIRHVYAARSKARKSKVVLDKLYQLRKKNRMSQVNRCYIQIDALPIQSD